MKWFDKWIEKQYLKKHTKRVEPDIDPTIPNEHIISVKTIEPLKVQATARIPLFDMDRLSERDIYMTLLEIMLPDLSKCFRIDGRYLPEKYEVLIHSSLNVFPEKSNRPDWFHHIKETFET